MDKTQLRFTSPADTLLACRGRYDDRREHLFGIYADESLNVRHVELVGIGIANTVLLHPREVFYPAILHNATKIVLVHTHPSGNLRPSAGDLSVTDRISAAGRLLGIPLLDHIIIPGRESGLYYSFAEHGRLPVPTGSTATR